MGQAFDRDGKMLGEAWGETKREVFDTLIAQHPQADEIRIKSMHEKIEAAERGSRTGGTMNGIGWAISAMQSGEKVGRAGWNGKGMWLALQVPDAHSKMSLPYIYISTVTGQLVPWLASQTDILATDWELVA